MEEQIRKAVHRALEGIGSRDFFFTIERPADLAHGDYATNAALVAGKILKRNPKELGEILAKKIKDALGPDAGKIEVAGPGFINITLSKEAIARSVREANAAGWGKGHAQSGKTIMVEYTDPNPFKEMHIGHLMSNAVGEAIARLVENEGAAIARANYQGDVGPHVAKALWGLRKAGITEPETAAELGRAYAAGAKAYESDPGAKAEIDELNKEIYAGDNRALIELWRKGRDVSLAAFEQLYKTLGTTFDYYFFESEVAEPGARIVRDGLAKGIFEESDGAIVYKGEERGPRLGLGKLHTLVFITGRDTPTYEAKELGLAFMKEERWPSDRSIVITANEQIGHFNVVLAALREVGPRLAKKTEHVPHGFLRLTSGKMSSREGNVITAAALLADVVKKASEKNADPLIAEQVAIGAIKYMILRQAPGSDIIFDPEKSLSLEGDSGPYLQYALVRARSLLLRAANSEQPAANNSPEAPYVLERLIVHYPEAAARAAKELSPNILTTYLTELAGEWNAFYAKEQVLGSPEEKYKMHVVRAFATTMENGLRLLGVPAPEKM